MEVERMQLKLSDKNINRNISHNTSGIAETLTKELVNDIEQKKENVLFERLKKLGIQNEILDDKNRRFKRFVREISQGKETIFYNNGSPEGLRIITFVTKQKSFNPDEIQMEWNITYF